MLFSKIIESEKNLVKVGLQKRLNKLKITKLLKF